MYFSYSLAKYASIKRTGNSISYSQAVTQVLYSPAYQVLQVVSPINHSLGSQRIKKKMPDFL